MATKHLALARYDNACRAISAALSVDEAKKIRNASEAMRAYARQAKNKQLEIDAAEIRIRAERRITAIIGERLSHDLGKKLLFPRPAWALGKKC